MSINRNHPCHCGSGQKYKKCCLPKDEASRVHGVVMSPRSDDTYSSRRRVGRARLATNTEEGFGDPFVRFCQPLIDKVGGDPAKVERALGMGMLFWNIAVSGDELGKELVENAVEDLTETEEDAEYLRSLTADMVARHRMMFPHMHADRP